MRANVPEAPDPPRMIRGRRVVLTIVATVVAISAGVGATVPLLLPETGGPQLFGVLALPPTPLGYALYGGLTTGALLGVGLVAVEAASRAE